MKKLLILPILLLFIFTGCKEVDNLKGDAINSANNLKEGVMDVKDNIDNTVNTVKDTVDTVKGTVNTVKEASESVSNLLE